jgi:hypothetical protein
MANVLEDFTSRIKNFSDSVDRSLGALVGGNGGAAGTTPGGSSSLRAVGRLRREGKAETKASKHAVDWSSTQSTAEDRAAAVARGEAALAALAASFFDRSSDPLRHELVTLGEAAGQNDVDAVVDGLTLAVEVILW